MKKPLEGTVDFELQKVLAGGHKPRLLLHACCGPCSAGTLYRIAEYFDITIFFYNPNIMPKDEFKLRLQALKTVIEHFDGAKLIVPEQDTDEYLAAVKGLEGEREGGRRCDVCFELRLDKTAKYMAEHIDDYDCFATTLTISPMKNAQLINSIGIKMGEAMGVRYLSSDFKKQDGYLASIKQSKEWDIYRQHYCGCQFESL